MSEREVTAKLRSAISSGDHKAVQRLVKGGADVNARFWYDSTLLHEAVSMSSSELVQMLLRAGADINSTNKDGRTALHLACRGGVGDIVQALIAAGTNVNKQTLDGKTCLHVAVWRSHLNVVELLVKAGADVNIPDSEGCSPLYWAARSNYLSILKSLVSAGAKINYKVKSKWTPLHAALQLGHEKVVRFFLLHGAETNLVMENKTVVALLMDNSCLTHVARQKFLNMFIQAGYNVWKDSWTPPSSKTAPANTSSQSSQRRCVESNTDSEMENMSRWLDRRRETLPTLTCLCRTRIRKRLSYCNRGRSIVDLIDRLPVPNILRDFMKFVGDPLFEEMPTPP